MIIEQTYYIDLVPNGQLNVVHASQYDYGSRRIRFTLTKDGKAYTLPDSGVTAYVKGLKPDGTVFLVTATVDRIAVYDDITGQYLYIRSDIYFPLAKQMTTVAGEVKCKLSIATGGDEVIGSASFTLLVDPTPFDDRPVSESEIPYFEQVIAEVTDLASAAASSARAAQMAAAAVTAIPIAAIDAMWNGTYDSEIEYADE